MLTNRENINFYSMSSKNELDKMMLNIENILEPTKTHVKYKKEHNMYDDWDEYKHDKDKYQNLLEKVKLGEDLEINIFCAESNGRIIGHIVTVKGEKYIRDFLKKINYTKEIKNIEQYAILEAWVIQKEYRGIGFKMMYDYVLPQVLAEGTKKAFCSSSHARAFPVYDREGEVVYEGYNPSDHKMYYRLSKKWLIDIENLVEKRNKITK